MKKRKILSDAKERKGGVRRETERLLKGVKRVQNSKVAIITTV